MRKIFNNLLKKISRAFLRINLQKAARLEKNKENEVLLKTAEEQFKILAKKGLSIQVFTL